MALGYLLYIFWGGYFEFSIHDFPFITYSIIYLMERKKKSAGKSQCQCVIILTKQSKKQESKQKLLKESGMARVYF